MLQEAILKQKKILTRCMILAVTVIAIGMGAVLWCIADQPQADPCVYTVTFHDHDGTVLATEAVAEGEAATTPEEPSRDGYTFVGWDKDFTAITEDTEIKAEYLNMTDTLFTVETVEVDADVSKVAVKVSVTNNPGILGMVLSVRYDDDRLNLVDAGTGSVLSYLSFQKPSNYADGCRFVWYGSETGEVTDGDILILTFEIPTTTEAGSYPISISWDNRDLYDSNCNMINARAVNGELKILG